MSFTDPRPRIRPDRALSVVVVVLAALVLAACGGPAASSALAEESVEPSVAPSVEASASATPSVEPSPSAAAVELCLPAEMIAAIEELRGGNFEPEVPLSELADAVEALDLSGSEDPSFAHTLQGDLVEKLREPNPEDLSGLGRAAAGFSFEVLPEIAEC